MSITLYSATGWAGEKHAPRWPVLWEALANILKMTIAVIDSQGRLIFCHHPLYSDAGCKKHTSLIAAFNNHYSRVPKVYADPEAEQVVFDPLGLAARAARLADGSFLLLGGRLEDRKPQPLTGISARPAEPELKEYDGLWSKIALVTPEEMQERLIGIVELHNSIHLHFGKPGLPGILLAVENVYKLIALTFDCERFDLPAILELAASFLAALTGGGGAFAFLYEYPGRTLTPWRGEGSEILQALAEDWKTLGRVQEPAEAFGILARERVEREFGSTFEGVHCRRNGASVFLGLVGAAGGFFRAALVTMAKKIAIALDVSSLSTVFRYRWGTVFNSIRQGIAITDNGGVILMMNQAAKEFFSGRGRAVPVAGQRVSGCGFGRQIEEAVNIAAKSNRSFVQERSAIDEGDSLIHLRWDVVPLLREDGCSAGAVLVFNDITGPVKIHHEIHDWERLATAGEVAAGLAHEIRNPLATAKAAIQLTRMFDDPAKREELLFKLERELDRMNDILTNFLRISKPRLENKLEPVNLNQILQELLFLLNSEALLNEVDLEIDLHADGLPVVLGSPNSIKQVYINIARNAIEAMGGGGKLSISTSMHNGKARVTFRDNGPGIPAENMATLTKPFFTTKPDGTGLGLSISASIVEMMDGSLNIKSNPGRGTTIDLVFPIYDGES